MHVLATPPAFRLSQDQTLQLNFLARNDPDAPRHSCELAETDTFTTVFILEMSLSIPNKLRQLEWLLLPHRRQGAGSVEPSQRTGSMLQGSNIFFWLPRVRDTRGLLKLIKEDHFACTTRMFEILACPSTRPSIHRLRDFLGLASGRDLVA